MRNYLLGLILLMSHLAYPQLISKDRVLKMKLKDIGEIVGSGQVTGYYFFLDMEKTDNGKNNFQINVYDENLREINSITINKPRSYVLIEGGFNGEVFGFMFYDHKANAVELISYDKTLKEVGGVVKPVTNIRAQNALDLIAKGNEQTQRYLIPVQGKGFIYYGFKPGIKELYFVEFFNNEMRRVWLDVSKSDENDTEIASEAFQSDEYIGTMISKRRKKNSKNTESFLVVQDVKDGKLLFAKEMIDNEHNIVISNVDYDTDKKVIVVFGEYFNKKDKELKDHSRGFITLEIDLEGNVINRKLNSWKDEIANAIPLNDKGKFDVNNTNVLLHKSLRTSDEKIFVIGEQYKKAVNEEGVALTALSVAAVAALGGGSVAASSMTQLDVYNMIIFEFKPDYSIDKAHIFEKKKTSVSLPAGSGSLSPRMVSYFAKFIGGFDYLFTQKSISEDQFICLYLNYSREKNRESDNILGSIIYTPEKTFMVDQMKLDRKYTDYYVFNAKYGYVMVVEYSKKEKKLEARIEKINY